MEPRNQVPSNPNPWRRRLFVGAAGWLLAGCASAPQSPKIIPLKVVVRLRAGADVNPDTRGRSSALALRWFELRTAAAFEAADFFSLFERSQALLGSDLLASEQLTLMPSETRMVNRIAHPDARYLGVIAAFRDLERSVWRVTVPIAPPETLPPGAGGGPREQFVALVCERNSIRTEST